MIFQTSKPPWLCSMLIFQGVSHILHLGHWSPMKWLPTSHHPPVIHPSSLSFLPAEVTRDPKLPKNDSDMYENVWKNLWQCKDTWNTQISHLIFLSTITHTVMMRFGYHPSLEKLIVCHEFVNSISMGVVESHYNHHISYATLSYHLWFEMISITSFSCFNIW